MSSEINVSLNDRSETDSEYIERLEQKKSAARNKKQQHNRQNQQLEQQQEQSNNNYYFGSNSQPPSIPYQAITEALKPNTGQSVVQKIRNKVQCPICHKFQHHNRYVLKTHIESHIEFAQVRAFALTTEREYKKLLRRRYELRQIELPRLQEQIGQLDVQIRQF